MSKALQRSVGVLGAATLALIAALAPAAAYADDPEDVALDALRNVAENVATPETDALVEASSFTESTDGFVAGGTSGSQVLIGDGADPAITLESGRWSLTISDALSGTATSRSGAVLFESPSVSTVPLPHPDGSVQITTVLAGPDSATSYAYNISSDTSLKLSKYEDGSIVIEDAAGNYRGAVTPPWAYDANGKSVDTWYEVSGSTITQVTDHTNGSYAYPIVADPWIGINLFSSITTDTYSGQPRVNLVPSAWGYSMWPSVGGQVIMNTAGWDEAWTWNSTVRSALNKDSQRQQFECHSLGSPFAGTWNLEKFRPNRTAHWTFGVAIHRCNWTTPNQY